MIRYLTMLAGALLLSGCATTLRSDVTVLHDWPAQMQDKSYVFKAPPASDDTAQYQSYLQLVRAELSSLGFTEGRDANAARLTVSMRFLTTEYQVRMLQTIDPFWNGPYFRNGSYFRGGIAYDPWQFSGLPGYANYHPLYNPFRHGPPVLRETVHYNYERQLHVTIAAKDGAPMFDVQVRNTSTIAATPTVMPALVASAFAGFPGQSGVPHQIDLKLENERN